MAMHGDPSMARLGGLQLLVYCECPCGRWLGAPEGGVAPMCGRCGGYFVPGGGPVRSEQGPQFGGSVSEARRLRCLGFAAFLTSEVGAVRIVNRARDWMGLNGVGSNRFPIDLGRPCDEGRLYTESEVRNRSEEIREAVAADAEG